MSNTRKSFSALLPNLGEQIRQWRLARKITQADLEQRAGLSHNAVSRIECGNVSPRIDTLERVAHALDVSIEQLQFQQPDLVISESQPLYGNDAHIAELINALEKLPETKKIGLIRTFMDLIAIAIDKNDG